MGGFSFGFVVEVCKNIFLFIDDPIDSLFLLLAHAIGFFLPFRWFYQLRLFYYCCGGYCFGFFLLHCHCLLVFFLCGLIDERISYSRLKVNKETKIRSNKMYNLNEEKQSLRDFFKQNKKKPNKPKKSYLK